MFDNNKWPNTDKINKFKEEVPEFYKACLEASSSILSGKIGVCTIYSSLRNGTWTG